MYGRYIPIDKRGTNVEQGWIASSLPNDSFSEGIVLSYDTTIITLKTLIEIHLRTHACTSNHMLRDKYRSAVYTFKSDQQQEIKKVISLLQLDFDKPIITRVLPLIDFKINEEQLLHYYKKKPEAPFCKNYIKPKLQALLQTHKKHLKRS